MRQAKKDLHHAKRSSKGGDYEWSCFAAQQAAEKAVKALYQALRAEAEGHSILMLLRGLPRKSAAPSDLVDASKLLDRHYIPTRYPNSHPRGAPLDYYTLKDAQEAVALAERIIEFCEDQIRALQSVRK